MSGVGLTVRAFKPGNQWSRARSANVVSIHGRLEEMLSLVRFRKAIELTNRGETPSDSRLLLRDGYTDFRRNRLRKAVIDGGSAAELELGHWNRAHHVRVKARATLGEHVAATTAPIPADTRRGLVRVRNDAIHNNLTPTHAQAQRSLEIAKEVLDLLAPLPL